MHVTSSTNKINHNLTNYTFNDAIFTSRREKLFKELPEKSLVIIPNNNISIRSNDTEYKFRPDSDFYYLTGFEEPNSICVLKKDNGAFTYTMFVEPNNKEKEIWSGKRVGLEGVQSIYKANESYSIFDFDSKLKELIKGTEYIYLPFGKNKELDLKITSLLGDLKLKNRSGVKAPLGIFDFRDIVHKMRLIKDNHEIDFIQKASDISKVSHILAMYKSKPGMFEYELEALIEDNFRALGGNCPAYSTIVGSGKNTTTLHYINNNKKIQENDLILIDAGCEYNYYASDVTRTFPVSHKFNSAQKDIYEIVLKAQEEAIKEVKVGNRFIDPYNKATLIIAEGLKELGLLNGSTEEIIKKEDYKKFFMHNIGHWLGLDVHDAGPYIDDSGNSIKLTPGMVLTIEPGIYIPNHSEGIPEHFQGIGVRIEDDILVTENGNKVLTNGIPKTVKEIELS
ncbi:MAG: aminopeptidase P N-terminal domain-containing protein [Candidatus Melainabacteria bacterium]|nr:aminopeptidase P N-terminal domain-containing protein [Candidatus Melainabacteria bacterium]